jgi:hypothetical protein
MNHYLPISTIMKTMIYFYLPYVWNDISQKNHPPRPSPHPFHPRCVARRGARCEGHGNEAMSSVDLDASERSAVGLSCSSRRTWRPTRHGTAARWRDGRGKMEGFDGESWAKKMVNNGKLT